MIYGKQDNMEDWDVNVTLKQVQKNHQVYSNPHTNTIAYLKCKEHIYPLSHDTWHRKFQ